MLRENTFPHHFATPSFQASLLCPLVITTGYTQSLQRGNDQHKEQGSLQSVYGGVCCSFLLTLTLCSSVGFPWVAVPVGIFGVVQILHRHQGVPAMVPWSNSSFSDLAVPFAVSQFPHPTPHPPTPIWCIFCPFLNIFSVEAPPAWLRGSAVPCDGSARMGWNRLCLEKWEKLKNRTAKMNKRIALPCLDRLKRLDFTLQKTRLKIDINNV